MKDLRIPLPRHCAWHWECANIHTLHVFIKQMSSQMLFIGLWKGARNAGTRLHLLLYLISPYFLPFCNIGRVEWLQASFFFFITLFRSLRWCPQMLQEYLTLAMKAHMYRPRVYLFMALCQQPVMLPQPPHSSEGETGLGRPQWTPAEDTHIWKPQRRLCETRLIKHNKQKLIKHSKTKVSKRCLAS